MSPPKRQRQGSSGGYRLLLGLWHTSYAALPDHPHGRWLAEIGLHAILVGLRRCRTPSALLLSYFDYHYAHADLVLLASLLPPLSAAQPPREHAGCLFPIREAAYWVRWRELQRGQP